MLIAARDQHVFVRKMLSKLQLDPVSVSHELRTP
jgi:hypothetical protein